MSKEKKCFIIGIGGTGMRCLETFTHMCAMGLYDGMEFNVLTLDTDFTNGNKNRTENLIKDYNNIKKTSDSKNGAASNDSFFSAKINLFEFVTDYNANGRQTFSELTNLKSDNDDFSDSKMLAELFLSEDVQNFDLSHGYRAQTHLGSYLMYHAITDLAKRLKAGVDIKDGEKQFEEFLNLLYNAKEDARIFVFGSIFGGTGASSIPVIQKALNDALDI
jgi:cell division GTPase FtsZ